MIPETQGILRSTVSSMNVGDYIAARYNTSATNVIGTISELGTVDTDMVDEWSTDNLNGVIYFVKIARAKLLCTIPTLLSGTFKMFNDVNMVSGKKVTFGNTDFLITVPASRDLDNLYTSKLGGVIYGDVKTVFNGSTLEITKTISGISGNALSIVGFNWNTGGTSDATVTQTGTVRFMLEYVDSNLSSDLFH